MPSLFAVMGLTWQGAFSVYEPRNQRPAFTEREGMRIRTIKPEFFLHEALYESERAAKLPLRLAFAGLWCAADREGRFKWEPRRLGVQILPYDNVDFSRVLDALATRGFIRKYTSGTGEYGVIPSFTIHQVINNRERESELPEPPEIIVDQGINACRTRDGRDDDGNADLESGREGKGREGNKEQGTRKGIRIDASSNWSPSVDQLIVTSWFHRRPTTPWSEKETKAFKSIHAELFEDGVKLLHAAYSIPHGDNHRTRKDLLTLLNNWQGEIDRWRSYKPAVQSDVQAIQGDNDDLGFLTNDAAIFHKPKP
jgi:hypothetical protein